MEGDKQKIQRQACEVYTRVVGYLSPISRWNAGKRAEFEDRLTFDSCACERN